MLKAKFKKDTYNSNILLWKKDQEYLILNQHESVDLQDIDKNNLNILTKTTVYKIKTDCKELPISFIQKEFIPDTFDIIEDKEESKCQTLQNMDAKDSKNEQEVPNQQKSK